eukprot:3659135-Pleurochrysis_carterae.AAC.1
MITVCPKARRVMTCSTLQANWILHAVMKNTYTKGLDDGRWLELRDGEAPSYEDGVRMQRERQRNAPTRVLLAVADALVHTHGERFNHRVSATRWCAYAYRGGAWRYTYCMRCAPCSRTRAACKHVGRLLTFIYHSAINMRISCEQRRRQLKSSACCAACVACPKCGPLSGQAALFGYVSCRPC